MLNIALDITDANKIVVFVIIKNYINIACFFKLRLFLD